MIERPRHVRAVTKLLRSNRVVALLGARQVGKSTLARCVAARHPRPVTFFDLEDERDVARLRDPFVALADRTGLVVLDEVQHVPDIFRALRVLADRPRGARFLVLGSASPELLRQSSETLAGRIAYHGLTPLMLDEVGPEHTTRLWLQGGFPRSFTARGVGASCRWRQDFIKTFLARDLPQLGVGVPVATLSRFWTMLAHYHGQTWNGSELARSFGVADHTVRRYLEALAATFVVRVLQPWHENLAKRQVKAPKVLVADSGLLHSLLAVRTYDDLERHPKHGASWEGLCIENLIARLGAVAEECHFWATHGGAELDFLVVRGRQRRGFEIKRSSAPAVTPSMLIALDNLKLTSLDVIYSGDETYPLAKRIRAVPLRRLFTDVDPLH